MLGFYGECMRNLQCAWTPHSRNAKVAASLWRERGGMPCRDQMCCTLLIRDWGGPVLYPTELLSHLDAVKNSRKCRETLLRAVGAI